MPVAADTTTKVEQIKKTKKVKKQAVKGEPAVESKKAEKSKKEVGPEGTKKAQKSREIKAAKKIAKQAAAKKYYEDNPEKVVVEAPVVEDKVEVEEKVEVKVVKTIRKKVDADAPLKSRNTLFVRNIPFSASTQQLEEHFSEVGPIRSCFIVTDGDKSKGFGYCQFAINEDATRALEKTAFEGKVLKIELSNRRPGRDDEKPSKFSSF
jgi:RNA recognition motif-containing protein